MNPDLRHIRHFRICFQDFAQFVSNQIELAEPRLLNELFYPELPLNQFIRSFVSALIGSLLKIQFLSMFMKSFLSSINCQRISIAVIVLLVLVGFKAVVILHLPSTLSIRDSPNLSQRR